MNIELIKGIMKREPGLDYESAWAIAKDQIDTICDPDDAPSWVMNEIVQEAIDEEVEDHD